MTENNTDLAADMADETTKFTAEEVAAAERQMFYVGTKKTLDAILNKYGYESERIVHDFLEGKCRLILSIDACHIEYYNPEDYRTKNTVSTGQYL